MVAPLKMAAPFTGQPKTFVNRWKQNAISNTIRNNRDKRYFTLGLNESGM